MLPLLDADVLGSCKCPARGVWNEHVREWYIWKKTAYDQDIDVKDTMDLEHVYMAHCVHCSRTSQAFFLRTHVGDHGQRVTTFVCMKGGVWIGPIKVLISFIGTGFGF